MTVRFCDRARESRRSSANVNYRKKASARLMHALARRGIQRSIAIDALVGLLTFFGGIPVRAHRAPTVVMDHARRIGVTGAALEAAVPVTVHVAQSDVVTAVVGRLGAVMPRGPPDREKSDHGVVGGFDDTAAGCLFYGLGRRADGPRGRD